MVDNDVSKLSGHDPCDRCGARGYVKYGNADAKHLVFCLHHGTKFLPALALKGFVITDDRRSTA